METFTLTEEQILVKKFPIGNPDSQRAKTLSPNYMTASDDADGSDSDSDSSDSDSSDSDSSDTSDSDGSDGA